MFTFRALGVESPYGGAIASFANSVVLRAPQLGFVRERLGTAAHASQEPGAPWAQDYMAQG